MIGAGAIAVAACGHRRPAIGGLAWELVDQTGSAAFTDIANLRVRIGGGAWQTLTAAGLSLSRTARDEVTVTGFADGAAAASAEYHYEQQIPGEPNSPQGSTRDAIFARSVSGARPVNTGQPGHAVAATISTSPVVTA